jgi:hypothetical protein
MQPEFIARYFQENTQATCTAYEYSAKEDIEILL